MDLTTFPTNREDAAEDLWSDLMWSKFRNGIYKNWIQDLECFADSTGVQVKVKPGQVFIGGFDAKLTSQTTITLDTADASNPRIDRIVLRLDRTDPSTIKLDKLTGTPATTPAVPTLTVSSGIIEIPVAQIRVEATTGTIIPSKVTDERVYTSTRGHGSGLSGTLNTASGSVGSSPFAAPLDHSHPMDIEALRRLLIPAGFLWGAAMGGSIPNGWLPCDGRLVSRGEYNGLFAAVSTTYGPGDGSTTFAIPDYRGRFLRGTASGQATGQLAGQDQIYLNESQIPDINPSVDGDGGSRVIVTGGSNYWITNVFPGGSPLTVTVSDIDAGHQFPAAVPTLPAYRSVQWCIKAH